MAWRPVSSSATGDDMAGETQPTTETSTTRSKCSSVEKVADARFNLSMSFSPRQSLNTMLRYDGGGDENEGERIYRDYVCDRHCEAKVAWSSAHKFVGRRG